MLIFMQIDFSLYSKFKVAIISITGCIKIHYSSSQLTD